MNIPRAKIGKDENEIRSLWKKKDTNSPSPLLPIKRRPRFSAGTELKRVNKAWRFTPPSDRTVRREGDKENK